MPQPIKEKMSQAPWRRGSWSKSAEAHTPAMAIRRKIAVSIYFQARKFSNTGMRIFFATPSDEGFELVIGQHGAQEGAVAFVGEQEEVEEFGMTNILAIRYRPVASEILEDFMREIRLILSSPTMPIAKHALVQTVSRVLPEFHHSAASRTLDERM